MINSDWITVAGIIISLIIGVGALVSTWKIQQSQYRYNRLRDLLQWAIDVHKSNGNIIRISVSRLADSGFWDSSANTGLASIVSLFVDVAERGKFLKKTLTNFDPKLRQAVDNVMVYVEKNFNAVREAPQSLSPDTLKNNSEPLGKALDVLITEVINDMR